MKALWNPQRTLLETDKVLCAPGNSHEVEVRSVEGKVLRVYKNLWPSLRTFWLACVEQYTHRDYIIFQNRRLTYQQVNHEAERAAIILTYVYNIRKGDRVGICSANCPEYLIVFWACQLIGAVAVLANAWLPKDPLIFCLKHTQCSVVFADPLRAEVLSGQMAFRRDKPVPLILLTEDTSRSTPLPMFKDLVDHYGGSGKLVDPKMKPEDNATVMFTSGTTGLPKGVLSTQRQFLTNALNTVVASRRAAIRRGEESSTPPDGPQKGALVAVPLFHVTGLTSYTMLASMTGMKIILMQKWRPDEAARLIMQENVGVAGGVPAMVSDLMESPPKGFKLDGLFFGGSPAPDTLTIRSKEAFPSAQLSQGYGLTETNSIAVGIAGEDYLTRPTSVGLPSPVNEVLIMNDGSAVPSGVVGEIWLRGPNVMKCYWGDPEATKQVLTDDGWLKTGDVGMLDGEGFLYITDRVKDLIIRGGENISSVSVENALYADNRILQAAAVGVPDKRLGELVAAIVSVKSQFRGQVTESELIELTRTMLPRFAVPVMIVVQDTPFNLTPSGKIMKPQLREIVRRAWLTRQRHQDEDANLLICWMLNLRAAVYHNDLKRHIESVRDHTLGKGEEPLPPSFFPISAYWTSSEKDAFFAGLVTHSRLRPDLIAEFIKTKTIVDVCDYLDALEHGALSSARGEIRSQLDIAMEVSQKWINFEEAQAEVLFQGELELENERRSQNAETGFANDEDTREAALRSLSLAHLRVINKLLRAHFERDIGPMEAQCQEPDDGDMEAASTLRADDAESDASVPNDHTPHLPDHIVSNIHPQSSGAAGSSRDMPTAESEIGPNNLTPRAKRRLQNRLYMRRKRAEQVGKDADVSSIKLRPGRQPKERRPPKPRPQKYKNHKRSRVAPKTQETESSDSDVSNTVYRHHRVGGMTAMQKAQALFDESEVTAKVLVETGISLFDYVSIYKCIFGENSGSPESISGNVLRILEGLVREYVTHLVHHVIVSKEEGHCLKRRTKVWKSMAENTDVSVHHVQHAVEMLSANGALVLDDGDFEDESIRSSGPHVPRSIRTGQSHWEEISYLHPALAKLEAEGGLMDESLDDDVPIDTEEVELDERDSRDERVYNLQLVRLIR